MDEQKQYHHGDLKKLLIKSVIESVKNDNLEKFSIREAARLLEVSPAAPYNHFNDTATTEIYTSLFVGSVRCV